MGEHLFLYGTLRPGLAPSELARRVASLRRVGTGSIRGRLYDLGPYPGAILDASADTRILGEVFQLPDTGLVLEALDAYECYCPGDPDGSLYLRVRGEVTLEEGRQVLCWVYVYNRNVGDAARVESGDYLDGRGRRKP